MNWIFILSILLSIVLTSFVILFFFQEKFIFLNDDTLPKNFEYNSLNKFDEVFIKTDGNNEINALHFKLPKPKGVVLFCHGNKGNLTKWIDRTSYFLDYNYEVLIFDYRNYGKSTGSYNEGDMYKDALAVYNHLKIDFKEENIVVYGFSLGSTFAVKIASKNNPKELILEAPFFNFKDAAKFKFKYAPTFLLRYKFNTNEDIVSVTSPITVFHGNKDKTTSFAASKKLFKLNKSLKNKFIEIDEGTHHNIKEFVLYKDNLKEILTR